MSARVKLVSSNNFELFEERLNEFIASLSANMLIVDIKFATTALSSSVEYSALVHYQHTEGWG